MDFVDELAGLWVGGVAPGVAGFLRGRGVVDEGVVRGVQREWRERRRGLGGLGVPVVGVVPLCFGVDGVSTVPVGVGGVGVDVLDGVGVGGGGFVLEGLVVGGRWVGSFLEFVDRYFGDVACSQCLGVDGEALVHGMPLFHRRMVEVLDRPGKNMVHVPPGHAKSTLGRWWVVYKLCQSPNRRLGVVCASEDKAREVSSVVRRLLTNERFWAGRPYDLLGELGPFRPGRDHPAGRPNELWRVGKFSVAGRSNWDDDTASVNVYGRNSRDLQGARLTDLLVDDVAATEVGTVSLDSGETGKLYDWLTSVAFSRVGEGATINIIGTRSGPADVYSRLHEKALEGVQDISVTVYPAITDEAAGEVLWPEHVPFERLVRERSLLGVKMFGLVYQQMGQEDAARTFRRALVDAALDESFAVGELRWPDSGVRFVSMDPASGKKYGGDTAFVVVEWNPETSERHIVWAKGHQAMPERAQFREIVRLCEEYRPRMFIFENVAMQEWIRYAFGLRERLAALGVRIKGHTTGSSGKRPMKMDNERGIQSCARLLEDGLVTFPWANDRDTREQVGELCKQMDEYDFEGKRDVLMAWWFADWNIAELEKARGSGLRIVGSGPVFPFEGQQRWDLVSGTVSDTSDVSDAAAESRDRIRRIIGADSAPPDDAGEIRLVFG